MKMPEAIGSIQVRPLQGNEALPTINVVWHKRTSEIAGNIYSETQLREALAQHEAVMKQALEALYKAVNTCFTRLDHHEFMSLPDHFCNQAIKALEEALK